MKIAVALLLEVPDGMKVSTRALSWQRVLNGGDDLTTHPIFGDLSTRVCAVEIHDQPLDLFESGQVGE